MLEKIKNKNSEVQLNFKILINIQKNEITFRTFFYCISVIKQEILSFTNGYINNP